MTTPRTSATRSFSSFFLISGILSIIIGALILIWPGKSAVVLAAIIAIYAIIAGLIYFAVSATDTTRSGWSRIGHALLGLLFVVAGVIAFLNPSSAAASFAIVVVVFIGIAWIIEGVVALSTLGLARVSGWTIFYAIVSILAGIALLVTPLLGAIVLWIWVGISLLVIGVFQVFRALSLRRGDTATV